MSAELARVGAPLVTTTLPTSEEVEGMAVHIAREYQQATAELRRLFDGVRAAGERLQAAFARADADHKGTWNRFEVSIEFDNARVYRYDDGRDPYAEVFGKMKRRAWQMLVDHLGIKALMSVKKRADFERQLEAGELPDISEETILGVILGLAGQAKDFAAEAVGEVFEILRPQTANWDRQYKTNDVFRVGRRVILTWMVRTRWGGGFEVNYQREAQVNAIDGVFHLLDGKGVLKERRGPLAQAINATGKDGKGETDYFKFRCFKNGNLHLEFKNLELVKQLNQLGTGRYELGPDAD